jgi:FkbH-like protein
MSDAGLHARLAWLPAVPADFSQRCRALTDAEGAEPLGKRVRALANYALDENQLNRLAKQIGRCAAQGLSLAPLVPFRLGIVSNSTTHFLVPPLVATAARFGIALECVEADYGQAMQSALSPDSMIRRAGCDAVLLALDVRGLPLQAVPGDAAAAAGTVDAALAQLSAMREGLHQGGVPVCIVQTLASPVEQAFGSLDYAIDGTMRQLVDATNRAIAQSLPGSTDLLLDVARLAETVGLGEWHDERLWNMAKLPFASAFLPLYADHVCRLVAALRGRSRKCLVLDLDNTVWGGVVGDDGVEGIVIGQGDATGEAHLQVQRTALMLRARGVVLAVSSKNNDDTAREPFRRHPEMLLREEHIAVFQANWNDKATNLQAIAAELSLGIDSLVFLDDNPVERALVRRMLPDVAVPELPDDPALYARTLLAAGYFEAIAFSAEDRARAGFYQDNARRATLAKQTGDLGAYLASLEMRLTLQPFDATGRSRIAQLINKSNQFNLTTRRYTEAEVAALQDDASAFTLQLRLQDTFGDNGMISVLICRREGDDWDIDTWLMSCRVLGRQVEQAVLQELGAQARLRGIRQLRGRYLPTEKNQLVEDHYAKLGFALARRWDDGRTDWVLAVDDIAETSVPMVVQRIGLEPVAAATSAETSHG